MAPVILHMDVHCLRCARKIRRSIEHLHGVERVWAAPESGLVFVSGTADASKLKWRIESKLGKPVTVVSDGERCFPTYTKMEHLGPPQGYPPAYPYYGGGGGWQQYHHHHPMMMGWAPVAPPQAYHYAPPVDPHQYVQNQAPVYFNDENPNACCVQ
ncbi:hypothetical protein EJB05_03722, partial [Eragrostis curvula]